METSFERKLNSYNKISLIKGLLEPLESDFIEIDVEKDGYSKTFLTLANRRLTIRKQVRQELDIGPGDSVLIEVDEVERAGRKGEVISEGDVDLLSLIPEETSEGYEIVVSEFENDNEEWLRVWYPGGTKGARQIEIRRFVNPRLFGELLGQYQAEGRKSIGWLTFTNKLIAEHRDFVANLRDLGIRIKELEFMCVYNPELISERELEEFCQRFEKVLDVQIDSMDRHASRGPKIFRTVVRSGVLSEILINAMVKVRKEIADKIDSANRLLAEGFLAKLLTGDGTLDATVSPARDYGAPSINIKIVDETVEALRDYKKILSNFDFHPHIDESNIFVRSSCSLENLLFLYSIDAFKNTNNWKKLGPTAAILLNGRRYKTYKRFLELRGLEEFPVK